MAEHQTTREPTAHLSADERHIGVILSTDKEGAVTRMSVNQWVPHDGEPTRITFGIYIGEARWVPAEMEPKDALKVAELILGKPAVRALMEASDA